MVPILNDNLKLSLNSEKAANKLAVCTGDGSYYDKHFDNMGTDDLRKLTAIYYLNKNYKIEHGGKFRMYFHDDASFKDIDPIGDRLLLFPSDTLVHSVTPSFAKGDLSLNLNVLFLIITHFIIKDSSEYRYALTIWLLTTNKDEIIIDEAVVQKHFDITPEEAKRVNG